MKNETPTLVINRNDSYCKNCGRGASPMEKQHLTVLSYSDEERAKPGCGVEWKYITSDYIGLKMEEASKQMRPDLEWVN